MARLSPTNTFPIVYEYTPTYVYLYARQWNTVDTSPTNLPTLLAHV